MLPYKSFYNINHVVILINVAFTMLPPNQGLIVPVNIAFLGREEEGLDFLGDFLCLLHEELEGGVSFKGLHLLARSPLLHTPPATHTTLSYCPCSGVHSCRSYT